ncbi:hypothetical protein GOP47_0019915 [Adiantum capillus-veneris]|uniref:Uncharacterized protein n=1 Tax=Adiantum capillus-veneris TaxID=13818 RepID=A0A9D4UCF4_ADICA|nr:hypothetical protein GOP47_0019915 [Adiantum capillus-veneris]
MHGMSSVMALDTSLILLNDLEKLCRDGQLNSVLNAVNIMDERGFDCHLASQLIHMHLLCESLPEALQVFADKHILAVAVKACSGLASLDQAIAAALKMHKESLIAHQYRMWLHGIH